MRFLLLPLVATALVAQGDGHGVDKAANQDPKPVNRLAKETSPYLRQHMHNPVDWYPWGPEALALAKKLDKPIFLSIGYSACHWCHVMEHESFEDAAIAKLMNDNFVCIKVDREERPDLDEIYMASVQAMTGRGGWPMSVWMTPDLKPFYGGTYFPPKDAHQRPGFPRVLTTLASKWKEDRQKIEASAGEMTDYLGRVLAPSGEPADPEAVFATKAAQSAVKRYDGEYGGFGQAPHFAPKFPHAAELSMLLRESARTGDSTALGIAEKTLTRMAHGGLYDQLAGGFHRYSVDRVWLVPHFEKMLYDNAQLARTYAEAYAFTGNKEFARIGKETLDYLVREMQHERGGFYSTTDADSEGVEGKYFVWSKAEVDALCGDDAEVARLRWGVTESGNWEHTNVLHVARSVAEVATQTKKSEGDVRAALERCRVSLLKARARRTAPGLDDKVLTAWNGLAVAAMAVGYQTFGDERYLESARRAADFVLTTMRVEGRLRRTWRDVDGDAGEARLDGYLEDYAFFVEGLLCLADCDSDPKWLREARGLLRDIDRLFGAEDGNFYFTAKDHESLIARTKSIQESSVPSGIAMATMSCLRAGLVFGDAKLTDRGVAALRANHYYLSEFPQVCPSLVMAMQFYLGDPVEIVLAGDPTSRDTKALRKAALEMFPPHRVVLSVHDGNREALGALTPVVKGKVPVDGKAAAYVCRMGACEAPVTDPAALENR